MECTQLGISGPRGGHYNNKNNLADTHGEARKSASLLLIGRDFEKCIEVCKHSLTELLQNQPAHSTETSLALTDESVRHAAHIETFVVIIVQAYAELDRWQDVLPYVTDVYQGIENVSTNILKLCLLLHAKVEEYSTCSAIYNIWMRSNNDGQTDSKHLQMLIDVFVTQILIPNQQFSEITRIVTSSALDQQTQTNLIQAYTANMNNKDEPPTTSMSLESPPGAENNPAGDSDNMGRQLQHPQSYIDAVVEKVIKTLKVVLSWLWSVRPQTRSKVILWATSVAAMVIAVNRIDFSFHSNYIHLLTLMRFYLGLNNSVTPVR